MSIPDDDPFELAYTAGVTQAIPAPDLRTVRAAAAELVRAAPAEAVALKGTVVTPDEVLSTGYVVVGDGSEIKAVQKTKPAGARVHETNGVICPGLIDLHGHPEFNVFAAWEPPQQFPNRYAWRGSDLYHTLVRDPQNILKTTLNDQTQLRYAEIRALVGGVTAIQGTSENINRTESEELVRNVDKMIFGQHRARAVIDLPSGNFRREPWDKIWQEADAGEVDAVYIHLAEGRSDNERSVEGVPAALRPRRPAQGGRRHPRHRALAASTSTRWPRRARSSSGRRRATCGCTPRRRRRARRSTPACSSGSAPTGCRAAARACSPR